MKKMQDQLQSVSKSLVALSKKVEAITKQVESLQAKQKAAAKKKPAKKKPAKKAPAKKAKARKKAPAKKAVKAKKTAAKQPTVLESVYEVVKNSSAGTAITHIREKTNLSARQLSNALYKLAKQGKIVAAKRGVYKKK